MILPIRHKRGTRRAWRALVWGTMCAGFVADATLDGGARAEGADAVGPATPDAATVSVADSLRKYRFLARSSRQQKNFDAALEHYNQLLLYAPDDQKARYFTGTILLRQKRRPEAKAAFLHSVRLDSSHLNCNLALTQLLLAEGKADSAWLYLQRVLRAKPGVRKYLDYCRELADLLRKNGDLEGAVVHYTTLSETATDEAEAAELYELLAGLREEQAKPVRRWLGVTDCWPFTRPRVTPPKVTRPE